jgi:hypothetical protein
MRSPGISFDINSMEEDAWEIICGNGPFAAAAIHKGNNIRSNLRPLLALSDAARLTEQDPFTDQWTTIAPTRIIGNRSRFEVDLNRPREKAIYLHPADAWGLKVWNKDLTADQIAESLAIYDSFYAALETLLAKLVACHGKVVVYDLHTYNHRRRGPYAEFDDAKRNPDVNVGTGTMDRRRWANVVERFLCDLRDFDFPGRELDVRENVRFFGGQFSKWIHQRFPESVCVLAIEVKKFFMDEWTGSVDEGQCLAVRDSLAATVRGVLSELEDL